MYKPIKLYIDTSVWNFALETSRSDSLLTYEFLQLTKKEKCTIIISDIVDAEINKSFELRKNQLQQLLKIYDPETIQVTEETKQLAKVYINEKLIPENQLNDAIHIACATVNKCNFIVSWNFQHMVRAKVIIGVHHINHREGYGLIEIVSPEHFLGKKE